MKTYVKVDIGEQLSEGKHCEKIGVGKHCEKLGLGKHWWTI